MRRALFCAFALVAFVAFGLGAVLRPHVVERYALYLGSAEDPEHATLFLDPFPNFATCDSRVRVFTANRERAFCSGHHELELGGAADAVLAADFDPLDPARWICGPRVRRR